MLINNKKYCKFMVGKHDIKSQEYWSNYVIKKFGNDIDPYWTTERNFYNEVELLDVLYVREDVRFKGI